MKKTFKRNKTSGTKEWSDRSDQNILLGCSHDCLYCYAKSQITRTHKVKNAANWNKEMLNTNWKIPSRIIPIKELQTVMYPSSHDITPKFLEEHIKQLNYLIERGFSILIVSKPHLKCIKKICEVFSDYKDRIEFRFTIGSADNKQLRFWEPGAPLFEERLSCLKFAFNKGFKTSVSCEPMLDNNIHAVIAEVKPYVYNTIWIGKITDLYAALTLGGYKNNNEIQSKAKQCTAPLKL